MALRILGKVDFILPVVGMLLGMVCTDGASAVSSTMLLLVLMLMLVAGGRASGRADRRAVVSILGKLGWLAQAPSSLSTRGEMIDRGRPWSTTVDVVGHGRSSSIMVDHSRTLSTIVDFG